MVKREPQDKTATKKQEEWLTQDAKPKIKQENLLKVKREIQDKTATR